MTKEHLRHVHLNKQCGFCMHIYTNNVVIDVRKEQDNRDKDGDNKRVCWYLSVCPLKRTDASLTTLCLHINKIT